MSAARVSFLVCLLAYAAAAAVADVVHTRDGRRTEGRVVRKTDREVVVEVRLGQITGTVRIPMESVERIVTGISAAEKVDRSYRKRLEAVKKKPGAAAWAELARWTQAQAGTAGGGMSDPDAETPRVASATICSTSASVTA